MSGKNAKWIFLTPLAGGVIIAAAFLLFPGPEARPTPRVPGERKPVHPAPTPEELAASKLPGVVNELSDYYREGGPPDAPGGRELLLKLRGLKGTPLYELELAFLDRSLFRQVRGELLRLLAQSRDPKARKFVIDTLLDLSEEQYIRHSAVELVAAFRTPEAFNALLSVHTHEPEFPGRYRLILAMAETRDARAVGLMTDALQPHVHLSERAHAAQGLGMFVEDGKVRDQLRTLILNDKNINVRINALSSLTRYEGAEVDDLLRDLAGRSDVPDRLKKAAEQHLIMREKG